MPSMNQRPVLLGFPDVLDWSLQAGRHRAALAGRSAYVILGCLRLPATASAWRTDMLSLDNTMTRSSHHR